MTSLPAATIGMEGRGTLAPGMAADVVVFDSSTVMDRATYEEPTAMSEGIVHVMVNGQLAWEDGGPTGVQAGRALRQCDAHNLLRKVQKVLLGGKGVIDIFDTTQQYDRAIALIWQGPISNARLPRPEDPEDYLYILVGAKGDQVYVNHRRLKNVTPEALKAALDMHGVINMEVSSSLMRFSSISRLWRYSRAYAISSGRLETSPAANRRNIRSSESRGAPIISMRFSCLVTSSSFCRIIWAMMRVLMASGLPV